jgi:hypothetical protein
MGADVYGPMIENLLRSAGEGGLTSNEIIESIQGTNQPFARGLQTARVDSGWGIRAALNRLFQRGKIAKVFEVEKDANGRPVDRPPRVELNQFGEERLVRVGPMRRYRFFLREFMPADRPFLDVKELPPEAAESGAVKVYTPEERARLQAEMAQKNDVQGRGKPE